MRFVFRAVFWLLVVSIFMPPESRVFNLFDVPAPARVGYVSHDGSPDNALCDRNPDMCGAAGVAIDAAVQIGVAGLAYVQELLAPAPERVAARDERNGRSR